MMTAYVRFSGNVSCAGDDSLQLALVIPQNKCLVDTFQAGVGEGQEGYHLQMWINGSKFFVSNRSGDNFLRSRGEFRNRECPAATLIFIHTAKHGNASWR